LSAEIAKLEEERDKLRKDMEQDHLFEEEYRKRLILDERFVGRYRRLDELNAEIVRKQQKLISLELASIDAYSQQFNKSIGMLNDSMKRSIGALNDSIKALDAYIDDSLNSLNTSIRQLLRSSTKLEILSSALIIGATASITLAVVPISLFYAFWGLILVLTEGYWLIVVPLFVRFFRGKSRRRSQMS